jgi:hypothetical protein
VKDRYRLSPQECISRETPSKQLCFYIAKFAAERYECIYLHTCAYTFATYLEWLQTKHVVATPKALFSVELNKYLDRRSIVYIAWTDAQKKRVY